MLLAVTVAVTGERIALASLGLGVLVFFLLLRELRLPLLLAGGVALCWSPARWRRARTSPSA